MKTRAPRAEKLGIGGRGDPLRESQVFPGLFTGVTARREARCYAARSQAGFRKDLLTGQALGRQLQRLRCDDVRVLDVQAEEVAVCHFYPAVLNRNRAIKGLNSSILGIDDDNSRQIG